MKYQGRVGQRLEGWTGTQKDYDSVCSSKAMATEAVSTLLQALLVSRSKSSKPCMKTQQIQAANLILTV